MLSAVLALTLVLPPKAELDKRFYPMAPPISCPPIEIVTDEAPDLKEWAEGARTLAQGWFPHVCQLLSTQDYKAPAKIKFIFREKIDPPAYATGNEIHFKADWLRSHPDDVGIVIHEMTHLIQAYPGNRHNTGWLVEGIADYIRWWRFEPEAPRTKIDFSKAKYTDAYRTTAHFLAWSSQKYDARLVPALDLNLRKAEDPMPTFKALTGKSADELWAEFAQAQAPK